MASSDNFLWRGSGNRAFLERRSSEEKQRAYGMLRNTALNHAGRIMGIGHAVILL